MKKLNIKLIFDKLKVKLNLSPKKKRTFLIVLCALLALILALLIVGTAYFESMLGLINKNPDDSTLSSSELDELLNGDETVDPDFNGVTLSPDDVDWGNGSGNIEVGEGIINIMLIGQDRRSGEGRTRSDVMMLCTINKVDKTITLTSFMRDMYVQIPGYQDNRINVCYALQGMELLDECLKVNFGVTVDGNVEVDFYGFMELIDLMGGVDIYLNSAEANYLNKNGNWGVDGFTYWTLQEGMNHLTGSQALAYARTRYVGKDDFERTERQRKVISALVEKCRDMNLSQLMDLMKKALPNLTTDLTNQEITNYILDILPMLSNLEIKTQRIPADGTYQAAWIRDMAVLVPDLEANRELLKDVMSE